MISQQTQDKAYGVFKSLASRAKQYAMNLSEIELKTEEATNNEAWGPTGSQMSEITKECYDSESFKQIMGVLARRLQDKEEDWRHVYKSLLLLEYMAKHGPQKVVDELVSNINVIEKLQQFQYKDKNGRDWGLNVRQRAKEVAGLVGNSERIRSERTKAKANESKYTGVSSDDMRAGGGFRNKAAFSSGGSYGGLGGSSGFGSSSARIDDDDEAQLHIKADSPDKSKSLADAVTETQKRIAALKHDNGTPPAAAADEAPAAAEPVRLRAASAQPKRPKETPLPESKAPKRLSEFRVNPNIAAVFSGPGTKLPTPGGSLLSAPPPPAAPAASAADLLGGLDHPAPAAASSQGGGETDMWSNFADSRNTGSSTAQSISAGGVDGGFDAPSFGGGDPFGAPPAAAPRPPAAAADPFGSVTAARPQPEKPAAANADPFGAISHPSPAQFSDPFAAVSLSGPSQAPAKPPAPASSDPFTSLGGPTPAPQSPMVAAASPKAFPPAGSSGGASGTPRSGMIGQPLPEDMFSMPMQQTQQGRGRGQQLPIGFTGGFAGGPGAQFSSSPHATSSPHARPGYALPQQQQQQQQSSLGASIGLRQPGFQQQGFQHPQGLQQGYQQPQGFQQGFQQPQGFGGQFGQAQSYGQPSFQAQDPFGFGPGGPSISVGQADFSSATPQHVSLPAAPAKKDPFAGLAGF